MIDQVEAAQAAATSIDSLADLGRFTGNPEEFWPLYLAMLGRLLNARRSILMLRALDGSWRANYQWPTKARLEEADANQILRLVDAAIAVGLHADLPGTGRLGTGISATLRSLPFRVAADINGAVLVLLCEEAIHDTQSTLSLLRLAIETPEHFETQRRLRGVVNNAERLQQAVIFANRLGDETYFLQAAMMFCNELATRFSCDRVSLGWLEGDMVKLRVISHIEKFDRNMAAALALEDVMEESLDQDQEVLIPSASEKAFVARSHAEYARLQGVPYILSIPLRVGGQPQAVVTAERCNQPFAESQRWEMRVICELSTSRLASLERNDRWIGARFATFLRSNLGRLWGVDYSLTKLSVLLIVIAIMVATWLPWSYRIDTTATLRSDELVFIPAPFDAYLSEVNVEIGDKVEQGVAVVGLDTRELLLEEAMAASEVGRFAREAEKAQAAWQLADMQIALARQRQSAARLDLVRDHLAHARIRAPINGVVVEGELKKNLGSPVKKGDLLLKIARLDSTFIELEIDHKDIHEAVPGQRGELAFVGRPDLKVGLTIERIEPVSTARDGKNFFLARARVDGPVQSWWRPGMGGTAKIDIGDRSLLWILTYRSIRFLRRTFWL